MIAVNNRKNNSNIVDITDMKPHTTSEVICLKCYKRWIAIRPEFTALDSLECPACGLTGFAIETGQEFRELAERNNL